jgi:hypothetical protein
MRRVSTLWNLHVNCPRIGSVIDCFLLMQVYLENRATERQEGSTDVLIVCSSALAGEDLSEADGLVREGKASCMSLSIPSFLGCHFSCSCVLDALC